MCVYIYLARLDIYNIYICMYMYEGALCMFSDTYIYMACI